MRPRMSQFRLRHAARHTVVTLAVLAAVGSLRAEESTEAEVTVGVAGVTGDAADRALFGQYNGLRDDKVYGLVGFGYLRRDPETARWLEIYGRDLGLTTRELGALWKEQGNWRLGAAYSELTRREPYSLNTGLAGAGTTTPQVNLLPGGPGSGGTFDLETKRQGLGASFAKRFARDFEFEVNLKRENKEGARLFGIGIACPSIVAATCGGTTATAAGSAILLLPEPVDSNHSQAEARLTYGGERLRLSAGYYGSFYRNANGALRPTVPGTLNNPIGSPLPLATGLQAILQNPVALWPDNDAHQFDLAGNLVVTPRIRTNFKLSYATATQKQDFAEAGLAGAPAGVSNLDGRVDTTLAQFGINARPVPKLSLTADWRYEDRNDKTPIANYVLENTAVSTNRNYSRTRIRSKAQASYQFPYKLQGTLGVDYEYIDRGDFTATAAVRGVSALRQETEEIGYRAELRRQMTETLSGALSYLRSRRDGSSWLRPNALTGVTPVTDNATFPANAIFAPTLSDRTRDKVRLFVAWQATEALSLQFGAETGKDSFETPTQYALRDTKLAHYSLDATYAISETWSLSGYATQGSQKLNQARPGGYVLAFDNKSTTLGLGVTGKPSDKFDLGGSLGYIDDRSTYAQALDAGAGAGTAALLAATGGLPEILYRRSELRLFGKYALSEKSTLRLDAIYQRLKYNDWAYGFNGVAYLYSDNTTVTQLPSQDAGFLGISYTYAWR